MADKKPTPPVDEDFEQENDLVGDETEPGCEPEEGCEEPEAPSKGRKGKDKPQTQKSTAAAAPAKAAPAQAATRYSYPFNVRYAAEVLDLAGFVDGQGYTDFEIRQVLIQNGYTEFADIEPAFHMSTNTNTLVITIKGSKKGVRHGR